MMIIIGIAGAIFILIVAQVLAQLLASLMVAVHVPAFAGNIAAGVFYLLFACLFLKFFSEKALKLELTELGMPRFGIRIKWLVTGLILPISLILIYLIFPGDFSFPGMDVTQALETVCAGVFFTGLAAGFVEEMVFRGFIMHLLDKKAGRKIAVIVPSILFGAVHVIGMDFKPVSILQVLAAGTFVGIMFSLITLEQDSVWDSAVVHALWNICLLGGFISIGESEDVYSIVTYVLKTKSFVITGGEFGVEASVIAIVGYIVVSFAAYQKSAKV